MISGCEYLKIDDSGLQIIVDGKTQTLDVDHIVICAGQESLRSLFDELKTKRQNVYCIGGAERALELDAKAAIRRGAVLAAGI